MAHKMREIGLQFNFDWVPRGGKVHFNTEEKLFQVF